MSKLPKLSGHKIIKALSKSGFEFKRQRGSHVILIKENNRKIGCVIPLHKEVKVGTLKGILEQAGVSEKEFLELL